MALVLSGHSAPFGDVLHGRNARGRGGDSSVNLAWSWHDQACPSWRTIQKKETQMIDASIYFPDWRGLIRYATAGPQMTILNEGRGHKALLAGLEAGGRIPPHPERLGLYHVLEGTGSMMVDGARYALSAGVTLIAPEGSSRGFEAETRLAFIAVRVGPEPGSTP